MVSSSMNSSSVAQHDRSSGCLTLPHTLPLYTMMLWYGGCESTRSEGSPTFEYALLQDEARMQGRSH